MHDSVVTHCNVIGSLPSMLQTVASAPKHSTKQDGEQDGKGANGGSLSGHLRLSHVPRVCV